MKAVVLAVVLVLGLTSTRAPLALAQATPAMGVIEGTVRNGTAGAPAPQVQVQLIAIPPTGPLSAQQTTTTDGRFRFEARADASMTYLLRTEHAGIPYLDEAPLLISPELPTAQRDLIVWETTREQPQLRIEQTTVSVRGVERSTGRIELQREDRVVNGGDRIWVGDAEGVTLRIPGPEALQGVEAQQHYDGATGVEGQSVTSTRPVRPGTTTFVATMVARYDPASDGYRLRVTAPLPTETIEVWVPERFANELNADGARASTEDRDGERWRVLRRPRAAREGEGLAVSIEGLSGRQRDNPLTTLPGVAAGAVLAFVVLAASVAVAVRLRPGVQASSGEAAS